MKSLALFLCLGLLLSSPLLPQQKSYDYTKLTPAQIQEIHDSQMKFYQIEGGKRDLAIKRQLLNGSLFLNANQDNYDVRYYGITVSLNFTNQSIAGHVDYRIKSLIAGLSDVDLDLVDQLIVDSVTVNGVRAAYTHSGGLLAITTPSTFAMNVEFPMTVYYHGVPVSGQSYADGGMGFNVKGGYQICWTATEPYESRNWWPCKDTPSDKADSLDMFVECPSNYDVATNGVVVSNVDIGGGRRVFHYKSKYPIVPYLVAITCADFDVTVKTWNYGSFSMPVYSYTLPNDIDSKRVFDTLTTKVLTTYSDAYGIYPFVNEKLGNANCGNWGTMEDQTCSFHESFSAYDPVYLMIHENAHQWWGDMITCKTFNHVWLNEGFGTYSESIFYERQFGQAAYFNHLKTQKYLGPGTIYVEDPANQDIFDGNLSYNKGAWVVHMLRGVLGDSTFFKAIRDWAFSPFRYKSATTEDFASVISNSVGSDMTWFVHEWIYGDGHPDYQISWNCQHDTSGSGFNLLYFIQQTQGGGTYFRMPIKTRFVTTSGFRDTTIWNQGPAELYSLSFSDSVTDIIVDSQEWILRTVAKTSFGMHIASTPLDGFVGEPYHYEMSAVGGQPPYHWSVIGGDIPLGLSFAADTTGILSGTPTWPSTYFFTLRLTDSAFPPDTEDQSYAVDITIQPNVCGDADNNQLVNISDVVYLIGYIFAGGPAPSSLTEADADCSGFVNVSDAVYLISYIFAGGPSPCDSCK